jgi:hypothetical protein
LLLNKAVLLIFASGQPGMGAALARHALAFSTEVEDAAAMGHAQSNVGSKPAAEKIRRHFLMLRVTASNCQVKV